MVALSNLDEKNNPRMYHLPCSLYLIYFCLGRKRKLIVREKGEGSREQASQVQVIVRDRKQRELLKASWKLLAFANLGVMPKKMKFNKLFIELSEAYQGPNNISWTFVWVPVLGYRSTASLPGCPRCLGVTQGAHIQRMAPRPCSWKSSGCSVCNRTWGTQETKNDRITEYDSLRKN